MAVVKTGNKRGGDSSGDRSSGGLLASRDPLAGKISTVIAGGTAAGAASNGAWFLCAAGPGAAWTTGEIVAHAFRPGVSFHFSRTGDCFGRLQFSVCGAAVDRVFRKCGPAIA